MLRSRTWSVIRAGGKQSRLLSGYKINAENYPRKKAKENYTEEDEFREKVDLAVLRRARTKLRGFEKISDQDILRESEGPDPNEIFRDRTDLPKYGSFQTYFLSAENERRRQREEGVWWENLDKWTKLEENTPEFQDIGLKITNPKGDKPNVLNKKLKEIRSNPEMERKARLRTLVLDPEEVMSEWENGPNGISQIKQIAHHYNIYQDLFENSDFNPVLDLEIGYEIGDEAINPVYYGNELLQSEADKEPIVYYEADNDKFFTLLLVNPDEHLEDNNREYVHWMVGNIQGNELSSGEILVDYISPFPARGTGYHRMVFVLFQHDMKIDFTSEKRTQPCLSLHERDFRTSEFFEKHKQHLTPVSLRFFQTKWEDSVQKTYHHVLNMPEPVYEYAKLSEKPRLSKLKAYPHKKTMEWLAKFLPKEPVYPDGSSESVQIMREAAIDASSNPEHAEGRFPVKNIF